MPPGLALLLLGFALTTVAFVALLIFDTDHTTPAVEAAPTAVDAAVQNPVEAGGGIPPSLPASGAHDFDEHVEQALVIANGADDFTLWTRELAR